MAAVPQKTLEWLYRVLTSHAHDRNQAYHDPNRTYSDTAQLLAQFTSFSPRTDVYTYENGVSALLLHLTGTLPVNFRGSIYRFPVAIWVPHAYPNACPMVYVTPTPDMSVRPGQHVSGDGRIYHHYLAHWAEARDRSTLVDFLTLLKDVFAKEPPVISKEPPSRRPIFHTQQTDVPPAVPPLPNELARPSPNKSQAAADHPPAPPKLPPKPGSERSPATQQPVQNVPRDIPPPLPPLPTELQSVPQQRDARVSESRVNQYLPQRSSSLRREMPSLPQPSSQAHASHNRAFLPGSQDYRPINALTPMAGPPPPNMHSQHVYQAPHPSHLSSQPSPLHNNHSGQVSQQQTALNQYGHLHNTQPIFHQAPATQGPSLKKSPTPDLLTSPFDLILPSQLPLAAPPPIPPNPEKDVLLQTLSRTLTQTLHANIEQTNSRVDPLNSQSKALHEAIAVLRSEIAAVNAFHANVQSNSQILQQSLHRADGIIADAKTRVSPSSTSSSSQNTSGLPPIDDVLVAPTVVGKQIYDLVTDERGIQRAIYALQSALVRGRVGVDVWAKSTRSLAREAFLKKALIRKAGKGMGLNVE